MSRKSAGCAARLTVCLMAAAGTATAVASPAAADQVFVCTVATGCQYSPQTPVSLPIASTVNTAAATVVCRQPLGTVVPLPGGGQIVACRGSVFGTTVVRVETDSPNTATGVSTSDCSIVVSSFTDVTNLAAAGEAC